jgi:hypothetical protein
MEAITVELEPDSRSELQEKNRSSLESAAIIEGINTLRLDKFLWAIDNLDCGFDISPRTFLSLPTSKIEITIILQLERLL